MQLTWNDIKGVVPDTYKDKHMTDSMREKLFPLFLGGRLCTVRILAKLERSLSPRDVGKLREKLDMALNYLTATRPIDEKKVYTQIMHHIHPSQKEGMGMNMTALYHYGPKCNFNLY